MRDVFRGLGLGIAVFALGLFALRGTGRRSGPTTLAILIGASALLAAGAAFAQKGSRTLDQMIHDLGDAKKAEPTVDLIVQLGNRAVDDLLDEVVDGKSELRRGWAIIALGEIGGKAADDGLEKVHNNPNLPMLIRTWAAAARFQIVSTTDELLALTNLTWSLPGLARPFGLRAMALMGKISTAADAEKALKLTSQVPQLQTELAPLIMTVGDKHLVGAMMKSGDTNVRSLAAAYLGSIAANEGNTVARSVLSALTFRVKATAVPWDGGALFLPAIQWSKADARALTDRLLRWMLWADENGKADIARQIENNLRSAQLVNAAGYTAPAWGTTSTEAWLTAWNAVVGKKRITQILRQQKLHDKQRYRALLRKL
jgi:hypothetical protein